MTGCIYLNCCACHFRATNAGDKGFCLARTANANGATLASNTFVANVNIAIASVKIATGLVAQGDVAVARKIVFERARTDGCVAIAFGEIESVKSISCVIVFMRVSVKCLRTGSRISVAVDVVRERTSTSRGIGVANGVSKEGYSHREQCCCGRS